MKDDLDGARDPVAVALAEDLGSDGDITASAFTGNDARARARIFTRQKAVLAGIDPAERAFRLVDAGLEIKRRSRDGEELDPDDTVLEIQGAARSILAAERTALNFLQRLSGVATLTRRFVRAVEGTGARILDTRKTTPGLRALEKAAVRAGGGVNHRFGLFDAVLVKDNHLAVDHQPESLQRAIDAVRARRPGILIEFEADSLDRVHMLLTLRGVDVILLDNLAPAQLREAVALRRPGVQLEASGGVNLSNVREIAATGVDRISVGALTHSAPAIDLSLDLTPAP